MGELLAKSAVGQTADVPMATSAEFVVMTSPQVRVRAATCVVHIRAWGQWTPGTGATGMTGRIYRGADAGGALVGEVNTVARTGGVGATEQFVLEAVEARSNAESVQYAVTAQQPGASGAGAFIAGVLEVEVISG